MRDSTVFAVVLLVALVYSWPWWAIVFLVLALLLYVTRESARG